MGKFVIECPKCGKYAAAKTGVFARRKIECDCGNTIHIKTDKMTTRTCPHCGNVFVHDQSDGRKVRCPVCRKNVVTTAFDTKLAEFSCAQCGVRLETVRSAEHYTCPVCDHVNDVAVQLKKEAIRTDGLASIIKYEGNNETFIWKHPIEDFNLGSQLIVHESQEAIFFRDGQALDLFGPGRYTLETQQLPILEKLYHLPTDTEGTFHSEVYYINLTTQMGIKWGTDTKVRLFDPSSGMHIELGASGEFNIRVTNSRKLLLKLVGTSDGLKQADLLGNGGKSLFRSMVMTQVKSYLAATIRENNINVLAIDEHLMELSKALRVRINPYLEEYGLEMTEFFVARIVTPDDDPNFKKMKDLYAEQYLGVRQEKVRLDIAQAEAQRKAVEAQTAVQMKMIGAQGDADVMRIKAQAEADALRAKALAEAEGYRAQAMAEAAEMQAKGYSQRDVIQADVQKSYAGALGQMGANGGAAGGSSMLGDIAGLGVTLGAMGGVIGMTKEAMAPMMESAAHMGQTVSGALAGGWNCSCGQQNITTNFCPSCGRKKPEPKAGWNCSCGQQNITTNFCPNCGSKKPEENKGWNCPDCGQQNISTNFCPNCGAKKPSDSWNCPECGQTGINTNFCPNCGHKKG